MSLRNELALRRFKPTAVTLLLTYLLVFQGLAVGAATGRTADGFSGAICFSKASAPLGENPAAPARPARHGDICCVFHVSVGNSTAASPFVGELPPPLSYTELDRDIESAGHISDAATPPLGSRAPPANVS